MSQHSKSKDKILQFSALLNEPGIPVNFGCSVNNLKSMIMRCREIDNMKPYCAIERWMLWDVMFSDSSNKEKILVVYANKIFHDEAQRFVRGGWVCSTAITDINEDCIFTTRNTHYILIGAGTRKLANANDIAILLSQA